MHTESDRLMAVADVAGRLGVSTRSVRRWAAEGHLPAVRVGRQYRFDPAVVEAARTRGLSFTTP